MINNGIKEVGKWWLYALHCPTCECRYGNIWVYILVNSDTLLSLAYIMLARMRSRGTLYVMYNALYKRYIYYYLMLFI